MLNETAPPVVGQPILDELARHLKLPETPDPVSLVEAECALRAAIAHLEAQLGLALLQRMFVWQGRLNDRLGIRALMAPISELISAQLLRATGENTSVAINAILLDRCGLRARISTRMAMSDPVALAFVAGFGPEWADTPADLRQACFMLAAHYFDTRHDVSESGAVTPHGVAALIAPWRPMRLGAEISL
jgi:uncharacterized phiE125 gp8 family phage protein